MNAKVDVKKLKRQIFGDGGSCCTIQTSFRKATILIVHLYDP
jgi:hypothetical protein